MTRIENWVLRSGLDLIHLRVMLWIYGFYLLWNIISLRRHFHGPGPLSAAFIFADITDVLVLAVAAYSALSCRLMLERVSVLMMAVDGFGQQILRVAHNISEGIPIQVEIVIAGLAFSTVFLTRAITLTYKIAVLRRRLLEGMG